MRGKLSLLAGVCFAAVSVPVFAQEAPQSADDNFGLEEIIVTAQKRSEKLSDVGLTISAFSGEALKEAGVASAADLPALVPGLLIALHHVMQLLRPRLGHGSDVGGRRTPWIIGGMAVLASGAIFVPMNAAYTAAEVELLVEDADPVLLIHADKTAVPPAGRRAGLRPPDGWPPASAAARRC